MKHAEFRIVDLITLLGASLLWSGSFVAGRILGGEASPMTLLFLRWGFAIVLLLPIVAKVEKLKFPPRPTWIPLILVGLFNIVAYNMLFFKGAPLTNSTNLALISSLAPIFIAAWAAIIIREKHTGLSILGAVIALMGVMYALVDGNIETILTLRFNTGDLLMLLAIASWTLSVVISRFVLTYLGPLTVALYAGIIGVVAISPFALANLEVKSWNIKFLGLVFYFAFGATVLAYLLFNAAIRRIGPSASGMVLNFNPLLTALLAWLILAETLSSAQVVGWLLVVVGVSLFYKRSVRPA